MAWETRSGRTVGDPYWIPAGRELRLHGFTIPDGMLYLGRGLNPVTGWMATEPALIDPGLPVEKPSPQHLGIEVPYWPSYTEIHPQSRYRYLEWLAGGRRDPEIDAGHLVLFFYGLERRVLSDARTSEQARSELGSLLAEVERLLELYGSNSSFQGHASSFLTVARLAHGIFQLEDLKPVFRPTGWGWEMPLPVRIALGSFVRRGEPIPAPWALSWFLTSGQARLRTPAYRCMEEFRELFSILFAERFPDKGMTVRAGKPGFTARYRPASPSLSEILFPVEGVSDVSRLAFPIRKLQEIADEAMNGLDAYSRWIGRRDDRDSPAALSLLPPEIAWNHESPAAQALVGWLSGVLGKRGSVVVPTEELTRRWSTRQKGTLTKREAGQLTGFFSGFGIGIEPDVRWGGPVLSKYRQAVVFRLPPAELSEGPPEPDASYEAATVLLQLAAALSAADGEVSETEERHLLAHLEQALELPPAQKTRLEAHLAWLLAEPPGLAGLKKRIEPLGSGERHRLARFLLTVAGADGRISVEELKLLQKIYPLLGLDAEAVTSDLHALMTGEGTAADRPVTVRPGEPRGGFAIPGPGEAGAGAAPGVALDMDKVRELRERSRDSQEILKRFFAEDDEGGATSISPPLPTAPPAVEDDGPSVAGLSVPHSRLLQQLATRASWLRIEIERLCETLDLLPDGALEEINEAAFETCGDLLIEGEDPLELAPDILKEMLA